MSTQANVNSEVKNEATPDVGFVKVCQALDDATAKIGGKWVAIAEYGKEHNLSRDVILASFKSMGKKYETAQSLTSRTLDLMKPENAWKLAKMKTGELSVRDARSTTISLSADGKTIVRQPAAVRPASVRIADFLTSASNVAVAEKMDLEKFLELAENAFNLSSEPKASKPAPGVEPQAGN